MENSKIQRNLNLIYYFFTFFPFGASTTFQGLTSTTFRTSSPLVPLVWSTDDLREAIGTLSAAVCSFEQHGPTVRLFELKHSFCELSALPRPTMAEYTTSVQRIVEMKHVPSTTAQTLYAQLSPSRTTSRE